MARLTYSFHEAVRRDNAVNWYRACYHRARATRIVQASQAVFAGLVLVAALCALFT